MKNLITLFISLFLIIGCNKYFHKKNKTLNSVDNKILYSDFINQSFDFPTEEFKLNNNCLEFHGIPLMELIKKYGTPLKFNYLPKISQNIIQTKKWFEEAFHKNNYKTKYTYCYCTKSSPFSFVVEEALKNNISLETSYAYDLDIVNKLYEKEKIGKDIEVICNGFKTESYLANISSLVNKGFHNILPVLDNYNEIEVLQNNIKYPFKVGIRIASKEERESEFKFYTSRLGIDSENIIPFYTHKIKDNPMVKLKMLHFFISTGIKDTDYYWNELFKCLKVYAKLKKIAPELEALNIGGGLPIKDSLTFDYDYKYMIEKIVYKIKKFCSQEGVVEPHIYTEFGKYTVGESGGILYKILSQKKQNDKETWNIIDSSFITTLPKNYSNAKKYLTMPINRWDDFYESVFLGGLTCDSLDYYHSNHHNNRINLPTFDKKKPLYIGFFNTGAYQETLSGYGGIHHCLIPRPVHILIDKDKKGKLSYRVFKPAQSSNEVLNILGY